MRLEHLLSGSDEPILVDWLFGRLVDWLTKQLIRYNDLVVSAYFSQDVILIRER